MPEMLAIVGAPHGSAASDQLNMLESMALPTDCHWRRTISVCSVTWHGCDHIEGFREVSVSCYNWLSVLQSHSPIVQGFEVSFNNGKAGIKLCRVKVRKKNTLHELCFFWPVTFVMKWITLQDVAWNAESGRFEHPAFCNSLPLTSDICDSSFCK